MNIQIPTSEKLADSPVNREGKWERFVLAQSVLHLRPHTTLEEIDELWQYINSHESAENRDICLRLLPAALFTGSLPSDSFSIETLDRFFRWVQEGIILHRRTMT